jgi:hypothetical protein
MGTSTKNLDFGFCVLIHVAAIEGKDLPYVAEIHPLGGIALSWGL